MKKSQDEKIKQFLKNIGVRPDRGQTQTSDHQDNPQLTCVVIIKTMKL